MVMVGHSKRLAEPLTRRQRRWLVAALAVLGVAIVVGSLFAALGGGTSMVSRNGCVYVTIPSTLGAGILHECGAPAREFCRQAQTHDDPTSQLARPQCVLAGYRPAPAR